MEVPEAGGKRRGSACSGCWPKRVCADAGRCRSSSRARSYAATGFASQAETNWESVQQDIRSLALRLEHAESKLQQILAGPREKPATTAASLFGRGNWAVVLLLGTVLVVGVFVYLTRSAPSSVMQACAKVSLSTDALMDHEKRMAANEIQCLEAEADTAQRRIEVLRDALKRGDNRVTRAK